VLTSNAPEICKPEGQQSAAVAEECGFTAAIAYWRQTAKCGEIWLEPPNI
jgi:hypothetical protein